MAEHSLWPLVLQSAIKSKKTARSTSSSNDNARPSNFHFEVVKHSICSVLLRPCASETPEEGSFLMDTHHLHSDTRICLITILLADHDPYGCRMLSPAQTLPHGCSSSTGNVQRTTLTKLFQPGCSNSNTNSELRALNFILYSWMLIGTVAAAGIFCQSHPSTLGFCSYRLPRRVR